MTWPFENDTSAVEKKLAGRSIKADKRRSVFVILTIALAVCLMGTLCFLYSAQQLKTLDGILGQYQAGCGGLTREEAARLVDAGKFEKWGCTVEAGTVRHEDGVLRISFVSPEMIDLMGYGEITGAYPQAENELCVERSFFGYFGLSGEVGQTVALDLGDGEKPYTVTGILEAENDSRIFTVWIPETAVKADGRNAPYELRFRFAGSQGMEPDQLRADIEQFFTEIGIPEDRTFYSSSYFGMVNLYLGNGMEVYVAAALIAVVCAIVIYNIFYISVMGKLREYGRLKVLGTTPKQLKRVVKRERRFLTAIAIPLGLLCAAVIALIAVPGYWSWGDNIRSAVVVSLLTYGTVLIATRKPMAMTGKVSAIEAIRATAYSQQQGPNVSRQLHRRLTMPRLALMNFSRNRKKAFVTALSLGLTGILLLCVSAYANSVDVKEMAQYQFGDRSQYLLQYEDYAGREFVEMQKENPLGQTLREELSTLYPEIADFTGYVNLHTEQDSDQLRRAVFGTVSDQRVAISGLDDLASELERNLRGELARDYGILAFIFVFSLINLANTLITNLLTRQQEFGIFQSVGMSDRQLSKMLSFECLYYVWITLLVTLTLGTACSLTVCRVFDRIGMFGTLTYHFPVLQVLLFGAALLFVQSVFSLCAVRYTRRLSLVERIKATD